METEIWKAHPEYAGIEVSTLGRVRTLDRVGSRENRTYSKKGRVLKQYDNGHGYLQVHIPINGKQTMKNVHRLIAQAFIQNHDDLPQINHKNCNRADNRVSNLEWCTPKYNNLYREKYGESVGHPVFAISLVTLEILHFSSQWEASQKLGVDRPSINMVIRGKRKQAGGFWFKADDGNGIEIDKDKLNDIVDGMRFTGGIFAVNLNTSKVSRFDSQNEAIRVLGLRQQSVNAVIKGRYKSTGGYWFVNDDGHAVDIVKSKLHDIGKTGLILS